MKQSVLLPWALGVDRDTGAPSEDPTSFSDMRNVVFQNAAVRIRAGLGTAVAQLSEDLVAYGTPFLAYGTIVWVIFNPTTRAVEVVETDLQGQNEVAVGTWGTLNASATTPPRFLAAESYGVLVFAHDDPNVTVRLPNYRFDPASVGTEWAVVTADLDGLGVQNVVARGVVQHLGYIWYWGFGSNSDPDRPEILRRSTPDDPTTLLPEAYIEFGARLSPIIGCVSGNNALLVFKSSSWYRLDGSVSADFSPRLVDPAVGLVSPRALVNLQGIVYWWSPYGPRSTNGQGTNNLAFPLDLTGPDPDLLPAPGPGSYAFTFYDPDSSSIGWCFPDPEAGTTTPVFKASLRADTGMRWSYDVLNGVILCAVLGSTGEGSTLIDPGYADPVAVVGSAGGGTATATITWTNVDCVGDETVEIWVSLGGGAYALLSSVPVNTSGPQVAVLSGAPLVSGTIDVALRHRRLGRYLSGYEDATDPSLWPVASQASGTIIAVATPVIGATSYDPATGEYTVNWTNGDPTQDIDLQLTQSPGGTGALIPLAAGTTSYVFPAADSNAARNGVGFIQARVRHKIGAITGTWATFGAQGLDWLTINGVLYGTDVQVDTYRASVALGSDVSFEVTRPDAVQVGNMTVDLELQPFTYGTSPANGGCSAMTLLGGQRFFYGNAAALMGTLTIADSDPITQTMPPLATVACATALLVGQNISFGAVRWVARWAQAGTLTHGYAAFLDLPGGSNSFTAVPMIVAGP